ncbi:uncharacterized protein N7482_002519 [Penicillium canariense]|uniref:SMP-30/Gluconolactonase/LRE-like region domain-containing protein n=1 Tax=Penicillium canariense TaxID=189055 RepID=A0A9W9LV76_9EURO|nr:uncharacterized protein N7482_002519 [Penicillium canariense]KAJ5176642.1 hypothetical protein N7482_002519 [Penicillium canariense]
MRPCLTLAVLASSALAQFTTQIFNFSSYVDIENSVLRPNGHLLLTTFDQGRLYTLDPSRHAPQAQLVAALPVATALCGITAIGADKFAVVGGIRGYYSYTNETLYTVDFSGNSAEPTIRTLVQIPSAVMLNGMAALPTQPHIVLIADSRLGCLFRVDTRTGVSRIAFKNDSLAAPSNATIPIGINGVKVAGGYVYFTNTARGTFSRMPVSADGSKFGKIEVIANLDMGTTDGNWDDFAVDAKGIAYVAQAENSIARIQSSGQRTIVAGGGNSTALIGPTSVQIGGNGKLYVTTRGGTVDGVSYSGQVVEVQLLEHE